MFPQLYTAASGMMAGERTLEIVAHNLANVATPGYRPDRPVFASYLAAARPIRVGGPRLEPSPGVALAGSWRQDEPGSLRETGSPLDLALASRGLFRVRGPGGERLTRDGSFTTAPGGELLTSQGFAVLDENARPITLPRDGLVEIARDGSITVDGESVRRLGIADDTGLTLVREGDSLWRAEGAIRPLAPEQVDLVQGYLEESSVSATTELISMIEAQRMFEMHQKLVDVTANTIARQALDLAGVR